MISLTRRLRSRSQLISDIMPQKKLNGVRRLNDDSIGSRRSNRLLAASQQYNRGQRNTNNNIEPTAIQTRPVGNYVRRSNNEGPINANNNEQNNALGSERNAFDIRNEATSIPTTTRTPSTARGGLRSGSREQSMDIGSLMEQTRNNDDQSELGNTQTVSPITKQQKMNTDISACTSSGKKRSQQNSDETVLPKKRMKKLADLPPITSSTTTQSGTSKKIAFLKKKSVKTEPAHSCSKHHKRKAESKLKSEKKTPNSLKNKKTKHEKLKHTQKTKERIKSSTRNKKSRKHNESSEQSSHILSDDQPSTSAAALAALAAANHETSINYGFVGETNNMREFYNESRSNICRTNNCVIGVNETTDEYHKKVERVNRVFAKYYESDSD